MTNALVITAAGINCDGELAHAFALAGAAVESHHINTLIENPAIIDRFELIGLPGGFSYGDAIAAGRIMAQLIRQHLYGVLLRAVHERRVPIFAPCNGFQIAAQAGLLPGVSHVCANSAPPMPTVALAQNAGGRFVDCWTRVEFPDSRCIWTQNLSGDEDALVLPSAHGEGRFVVDDNALLDRLEAAGQVAVTYHEQENFNGSVRRIAGICDPTGLILGLMPHPERFTSWSRHPRWTRLEPSVRETEPIGLQMFRNAVSYVQNRANVAAPGTPSPTSTSTEEETEPGVSSISAAGWR